MNSQDKTAPIADPEHHGKPAHHAQQEDAATDAPLVARPSDEPIERATLQIPALAAPKTGPWSVRATLSGKHIFVTGATGFLAKVYVSMLLRYHPDIAQLYLLIRGRRTQPARDRFQKELVDCGAFSPLHDIWGDGLRDFLNEKVTIVSGDITDRYLGMTLDQATELSNKLDLFVNSAGLTNFNPNLESALTINTLSTRNILEFLELGGLRAALLHVSTAFVAGNTQRPTPEVAPEPHIYPRFNDLKASFDAEREIADCLRMIAHVQALADDQERTSQLLVETKEAIRKKNLDPNQPAIFQKHYAEFKDEWIKRELSRQGRERAAHWGWPNIYTYTKSMGERLICAQRGRLNFSIFRPAIIESSVSFPVPGWNEGVNTTAPLIYVSLKGQGSVPCKPQNALDVIPVDYVTGEMLSIGAGLLERRAHEVYHSGSSDQNRISMPRIVELTALANRKLRHKQVNMPIWEQLLRDAWETVPVDKADYDRQSAPGMRRGVNAVRGLLDKLPTKSLGALGKAIQGVSQGAKQIDTALGTIDKMFEIFMPFIYHNCYTFIARNIVELTEDLLPEEKPLYGSRIRDLDWRDYWLNIHVPGLQRFVFPELERKLAAQPKPTYTYQDLLDLFDSSTANHTHRTALQHHKGTITERYTYGELAALADRAAAHLRGVGVADKAPVLLVSENRPQWAMSYFGILKAGGTPVPVDQASAPLQIANIIAASDARFVILSPAVLDRVRDELEELLHLKQRTARHISFHELFALQLGFEPQAPTPEAALTTTQPSQRLPDQLASLIFTSGTTGIPKGVMLTHQNFTHLLSSMQRVFQITERDGFMSVLPLHHTFEFTCGMLMPLSRGASITYLEEINAPELTSTLKDTRITAILGVPALWQIFYKRIDDKLSAAPSFKRALIRQLLGISRMLRDRYNINIGPMLFGAAHAAFGGRVRYLISGAASLPEDVHKLFHSMGFNLYEGYGLTEAAPVLTVSRPGKDLKIGSVGKALPGVEIAIHHPNDEGVGEVIARGKNIMLGYLNREEDTQRVLQDGWLHTGDLGTIDRKGRLSIVGRAKELIVTSGGKNVYPDELEDLYGCHKLIDEISIVGLPDGRGTERVAALIRPKPRDGADEAQREADRAAIREHIQVEGARVSSHNRIQVLRFSDEPLPRTTTRKIKRSEVIKLIERLIDLEHKAHEHEGHEDSWRWLDELIGQLASYNPDLIYPSMHFQDDLGFDSLMSLELVARLKERGHIVDPRRLESITTIAKLRDLLTSHAGDEPTSTALVHVPRPTHDDKKADEYSVPKPLAKLGRDVIRRAQRVPYDAFYKVEVYGRANLPYHNPNCIIVSNHSSHLDMGLIKRALGDFGADIRALAAEDYFYKDKLRRTYFNNFTNLIPLKRSGTLEGSLGPALASLQNGDMLLVFPEGTRTRDGKLQPFRHGVGYLADQVSAPIVPIYIDGSFRAFPKGQKLPSLTSRRLRVYIGPTIDTLTLQRSLQGMGPTERYRAITQHAQDAVEALRDVYVLGKRPGKKAQGPDLQPLFHTLTEKFAPNQLDAQVSFYFTLGNEDDHKWTVIADASSCRIQQGKPPGGAADCVVKTSPEVFRKMIEERYVPSFDEFINGTIKTSSPELLMRFQSVFNL